MECVADRSNDHCTCTYAGCDKRGNCCRCVRYHRDRGQIPGCFFTSAGERLHDRSLAAFLRDQGR